MARDLTGEMEAKTQAMEETLSTAAVYNEKLRAEITNLKVENAEKKVDAGLLEKLESEYEHNRRLFDSKLQVQQTIVHAANMNCPRA